MQKQSTIQPKSNNKEEITSSIKNQEPNLKKKQKPAWAKTAQENEQTEQKEVD